MTAARGIKVVILDIEGTVCPISFVKDVLFPYALKVLSETVVSQWDNPDFKKYRDAFPPEYASNQDDFQAHVRDLVARDVKISYLKSLQGYLWEEGYKSGHLRAPLFPDVPINMSRWHDRDLRIMIYSSGSVPAQKLLFKHTNAEPSDLTFLISDWFDTVNAGLKTETSSYEMIASQHPEYLASQWLFLSDNVKEVDAALAAGMQSMVVQRLGNAVLSQDVLDRLHVIETFDALGEDLQIQTLSALGKRDRSPDKDGAETKDSKASQEPSGDSDQPKKARPDDDDKPEAAAEEPAQGNDKTTEVASAVDASG